MDECAPLEAGRHLRLRGQARDRRLPARLPRQGWGAGAWSVRLLWVVYRTSYSIWPVWPLAKSQIRILVVNQRSHLFELTYSQTRHWGTLRYVFPATSFTAYASSCHACNGITPCGDLRGGGTRGQSKSSFSYMCVALYDGCLIAYGQGLTLVDFSAQLEPFLTHNTLNTP